MTEQDKALAAFAIAMVVALCTVIFAFVRDTREQQHPRRTLLNALFAALKQSLPRWPGPH